MKSRVKNIISILSVMLLFNTVNVYATPPLPRIEGEYNIENNSNTQYSMFAIPKEVYQNAGRYSQSRVPDVRKLVLTDDKGEEVPYFIINKHSAESVVKESYETALVYGDYENVNPSYVFKVYKNGNSALNYNKVKVNTNQDTFSKTLRVFGSYDNVNFTPILTQNIYVIESENANNVCFNTPVDYDFLKLQVVTDDTEFEITDIEVSSDILYTNNEFYNSEIKLEFEQENYTDENTTIVYLGKEDIYCDELKHRDVVKFRFEVEDERFKRDIELLGYEYSRSDTLAKTSSDMPELYGDNLDQVNEFKIYNKSDKPLTITGIYATVVDEYVVFDNRGHNNVKLNFTSYEEEVKQYDLSLTIADDDLNNNVQIVNTEYVYLKDVADYSESDFEFFDEKTILNGVLILVVVVIALVGILNIKKKSK